MNRQPWLLNPDLLKAHPAFRAVLLTYFISIVSLGLLGVTVPMQIQMMTQSVWQVGLSVTLTGSAMLIGLIVGGVLADHYKCKKVILLAYGTCGIGFAGLCLNVLLPEPSLLAIYLPGLWDGFFVSLGAIALLVTTPALVERENLMQVGATTILTVRLGSVASPMLGGMLFATDGVAQNYGLAAAGAFIILLPLLSLLALPPPPRPHEHPLKSLLAAFRSLFASPLTGGVALLSGLLTMVSTVRVLYPVLTINQHTSSAQISLLYVIVPLGAAAGALISGQLVRGVYPGLITLTSTVTPFLVIGSFSLMLVRWLGVICLALLGWLNVVNSLSQYTPLQAQTPEAMPGRISGLWTTQNVTGDVIGTALLGGLGTIMTPVVSAGVSGFELTIVGLLLLLLLGEIRRSRQVPVNARSRCVLRLQAG